jgi:hypothetical protein
VGDTPHISSGISYTVIIKSSVMILIRPVEDFVCVPGPVLQTSHNSNHLKCVMYDNLLRSIACRLCVATCVLLRVLPYSHEWATRWIPVQTFPVVNAQTFVVLHTCVWFCELPILCQCLIALLFYYVYSKTQRFRSLFLFHFVPASPSIPPPLP